MSPMRQYFVYYVLIVLVAALPLGNSTGNSPSPTSSDPEMETPPLQVPHGTYYVQVVKGLGNANLRAHCRSKEKPDR